MRQEFLFQTLTRALRAYRPLKCGLLSQVSFVNISGLFIFPSLTSERRLLDGT